MSDVPEHSSGERAAGRAASGLDERLCGVLVEFLDTSRAGRAPDRARLLADYPDMAGELEGFFAEHDRMQRLVELAGPPGAAGQVGPEPASVVSTPDPRSMPTIALDAEKSPAWSEGGGPGAILRRFGDYELLEEIARGGMGVVYKARQVSLNRIVAVKMILAGELAAGEDVQRFRTEAEAAANLQHPNIVKIYGVGEHEGQHYFSMEYVEGESLGQLIHGAPLPPKRAARYLQQIAEAIDYAHRKGVLHRDIKPSNVLVDGFDEARVMDFGLAKRVEADSRLTATGQILGTPAYMSPEQVTGDSRQVGPAADVFSLGAVFYEMLTGRPPFQGRSHFEILLQIRNVDPELPQKINPQVPRELAMICLKCLEKDPARRYPSAGALADDLARFANGDSISIASMSLFERLTREFERSHHDVELSTWGDMTLWVAGIVAVTHAAVFALVQLGVPRLALWHPLVRGGEFAAIGLVLWTHWRQWYPPRGMPAKQCWAIWFSYLAGSVVLAAAGWISAGSGFDPLTLYPQFAVLASIGLFVLGSSYWGYCYAFGLGFLVLALLMALVLSWAPLLFGASLGLCFWILGRHLRGLVGEK